MMSNSGSQPHLVSMAGPKRGLTRGSTTLGTGSTRSLGCLGEDGHALLNEDTDGGGEGLG